MRGQSVDGPISDDDIVELLAPEGLEQRENRTLSPRRVRNLSTGGDVVVRDSHFLSRAIGPLGKLVYDAVKEVVILGVLAAAAYFGLRKQRAAITGWRPRSPLLSHGS
jgi:hypothetical protein